MFHLLSIISLLFTGKELIKEKLEKPAPEGTRFDWDAYYEDVRNGMTTMQQIEKEKRGGYYTTKPKTPEWYELPMETVVDEARYKHDKEVYGDYIAESWRKNGKYRQIKKF